MNLNRIKIGKLFFQHYVIRLYLDTCGVIELDQQPGPRSDSDVQVVETPQEYRHRVFLADGARRTAPIVDIGLVGGRRLHCERGQRGVTASGRPKGDCMTSG